MFNMGLKYFHQERYQLDFITERFACLPHESGCISNDCQGDRAVTCV